MYIKRPLHEFSICTKYDFTRITLICFQDDHEHSVMVGNIADAFCSYNQHSGQFYKIFFDKFFDITTYKRSYCLKKSSPLLVQSTLIIEVGFALNPQNF